MSGNGADAESLLSEKHDGKTAIQRKPWVIPSWAGEATWLESSTNVSFNSSFQHGQIWRPGERSENSGDGSIPFGI